MAETSIAWGGWEPSVRDEPFPLFADVQARCPVHRVRLADGHEAWLVVGHDAARQSLSDARLSKDMVAALDGDRDVVAEGLPGPAFSRHMLNVDRPDHTRLRKLVAPAFMPSRIDCARTVDPADRRRTAVPTGGGGTGRRRRPRRRLRPPAAVRCDRRTARCPG